MAIRAFQIRLYIIVRKYTCFAARVVEESSMVRKILAIREQIGNMYRLEKRNIQLYVKNNKSEILCPQGLPFYPD